MPIRSETVRIDKPLTKVIDNYPLNLLENYLHTISDAQAYHIMRLDLSISSRYNIENVLEKS